MASFRSESPCFAGFKSLSTLLLLLTITSIKDSSSECPIEAASIRDRNGQLQSVYDWRPGTFVNIKVKGYPDTFTFSQPGIGIRPWNRKPQNAPHFEQVVCQDHWGSATGFYNDIEKFYNYTVKWTGSKIEWLWNEKCPKRTAKSSKHWRNSTYLLCPLEILKEQACVIWMKERYKQLEKVFGTTRPSCIPFNFPFCDFEKIAQKAMPTYCKANGLVADLKTECELKTEESTENQIFGILNSPKLNCSDLDPWRKVQRQIPSEKSQVTIATCSSKLSDFEGRCHLSYSGRNLQYTLTSPVKCGNKSWTVDILDNMRGKSLDVHCLLERKRSNTEWVDVKFALELVPPPVTKKPPVELFSKRGIAILTLALLMSGISCLAAAVMAGWLTYKKEWKKKHLKEKRESGEETVPPSSQIGVTLGTETDTDASGMIGGLGDEPDGKQKDKKAKAGADIGKKDEKPGFFSRLIGKKKKKGGKGKGEMTAAPTTIGQEKKGGKGKGEMTAAPTTTDQKEKGGKSKGGMTAAPTTTGQKKGGKGEGEMTAASMTTGQEEMGGKGKGEVTAAPTTTDQEGKGGKDKGEVTAASPTSEFTELPPHSVFAPGIDELPSGFRSVALDRKVKKEKKK